MALWRNCATGANPPRLGAGGCLGSGEVTNRGPSDLLPLDVVSIIYEATDDASRWPDVVRRLTRWIGGTAGCLQVRRIWPEPAGTQVWAGVPPELERAYADH